MNCVRPVAAVTQASRAEPHSQAQIHKAAQASSKSHPSQATGPGGAFVVTFDAQAGRSYTVQYRTSLSSGTWLEVADVPAGAAGSVQVTDSGSIGQPARFYRIVSPAQ